MYLMDDADFSKMKFAVNKPKPTDDLLKKVPSLSLVKQFAICESNNRDKMIRYCLYMYDSGSPLISMFPDIKQRKIEAATISGFTKDEDEEIMKLYTFENSEFLKMVHEFLVYQNNRVWAMIVSSEQTFYEYQQKLLKPVTDADGDKNLLQATQIKSKLMEDCDSINQRLEGYYRKFYGDDEELVKKSDSFRRFTPEDIANLK
jgi:hypothetical protein